MSSIKTESDTEQTKDYSNRALTLAGRISMGLAAANIPPDVMKFFIDHPQATNNLCAHFAEKPLLIEAHIVRPSNAGGVIGLIQALWGKLNMFGVIQEHCLDLGHTLESMMIHKDTDVVITDHPTVCNRLLLIKAKHDLDVLEIIYIKPSVVYIVPNGTKEIIVRHGFNRVGENYFTSDSVEGACDYLIARQLKKLVGSRKTVTVQESKDNGSLVCLKK
jgi:hypothetical protein